MKSQDSSNSINKGIASIMQIDQMIPWTSKNHFFKSCKSDTVMRTVHVKIEGSSFKIYLKIPLQTLDSTPHCFCAASHLAFGYSNVFYCRIFFGHIVGCLSKVFVNCYFWCQYLYDIALECQHFNSDFFMSHFTCRKLIMRWLITQHLLNECSFSASSTITPHW